MNGLMAPVTYASQEEIRFQIPSGIAGLTKVSLYVGARESEPETIQTEALAPGLLAGDNSVVRGVICSSGVNIADDRRPVGGQVVSLYGMGFGQTQPEQLAGQIATNAAPLRLKCSARIGGQTAEVLYAGSAPGQISAVTQINVRIPWTTPRGKHAVIIDIGGQRTLAALIPVG